MTLKLKAAAKAAFVHCGIDFDLLGISDSTSNGAPAPNRISHAISTTHTVGRRRVVASWERKPSAHAHYSNAPSVRFFT